MNNLYLNGEYCMKFSNQEIVEYFVERLKRLSNYSVEIFAPKDKKLVDLENEKIAFVSFSDGIQEITTNFWGHETAIFIRDEKFMFVDDKVKQTYCDCETYANVIYEGTLRDKTHREILELIGDFVLLLEGTKSICIEEDFVSAVGIEYTKYNYTVKITNDSQQKTKRRFNNILFVINEQA